MNLEIQKLNLIEQLMKVKEQSVLQMVEELLKKERIKAYEQSLQPMTVNELEVRLNKSAEEIKEGKVYTTEQLKNHFKKDE